MEAWWDRSVPGYLIHVLKPDSLSLCLTERHRKRKDLEKVGEG